MRGDKLFILISIVFIPNLLYSCGAAEKQNFRTKGDDTSIAHDDNVVPADQKQSKDINQDAHHQVNNNTHQENPPPDNGPQVDETPLNIEAFPESYLSYDEIATLMRNWSSLAPQIMEFAKYGSDNGHDTIYLRISAAVTTKENLPKVLIDAATHGDEVISTAAILGVMHRILSDYGKDEKITALIKSRDIYFVPITCPTGYINGSRYVEDGKDPNRTYPLPISQSEPAQCISAIMNLFNSVKFNATIDYHASGRMMLLPYAYTNDPLPNAEDSAKYRTLAKKMADSTGYYWGAVPDMVGYTADNSSIDYFYMIGKAQKYHTFAMGTEVGTSKQPPTREILEETENHFKALSFFIDEAPLLFSPSYAVDDEYIENAPPLVKGREISPYFVPGEE